MNRILKQREKYNQIRTRLQDAKFKSKVVYLAIKGMQPTVLWCKLLWNNPASPRAQFTLWLACHDRLAMKERLHRFQLIDSPICVFCTNVETTQHLFFDCPGTRDIWYQILKWIWVLHHPSNWKTELDWFIKSCKGRGWKSILLKCAATETIYHTWKYKNAKFFGKDIHRNKIVKDILDATAYRVWENRKVRKQLAMIMV
ncbi:uncharacterized protein LOC131659700 [Vicia villosa]|uniref:uncharacterized protein LOC131659700 n=1 Tax=Vicia villosa TaxID=3911 RepID=UPI00273CC543|nr:uncharacterized protein LOC131659700 [Vicia villosa]